MTDLDRKRDYRKVEPVRTIVLRSCPDERCGERYVTPVPHPDDPTQTPNRCPTCLGTVTDV